MNKILVKTFAKAIFPFGEYAGVPCLYIAQGKEGDKNQEFELGELYTKVLSFSKVKYLWIDADISKQNPSFFEVLVGLAKKGRHKIIARLPMTNDVATLRMLRNVALILIGNATTENTNMMNPKSWGYLAEMDSLVYKIKNFSEYDSVSRYLKNRTLGRPTIVFHLSKTMDNAEYEKIVNTYYDDATKFTFRTRLVDTKGMDLVIGVGDMTNEEQVISDPEAAPVVEDELIPEENIITPPAQAGVQVDPNAPIPTVPTL